MGCDIHLITQVRNADGKWETHEVLKPCFCTRNGRPGKLDRLDDKGKPFDCYWCRGTGMQGLWEGRNYDLFGILADVRNGSHGEEFIPISPPKGIPEDMVRDADLPEEDGFGWPARYDDYHGGHDLGDHSQSWLTLRELLEYPHWNKVVRKRGGVTAEGFKAWEAKGGGEPVGGYFGGSSGVEVSNGTMRDLIAAGKEAPPDLRHNPWTFVEWDETYKDCAESFYQYSIPALAQLGGPDDVRIVFGFDS